MSEDNMLLELLKKHMDDDSHIQSEHFRLLEKISQQNILTKEEINKLDKTLELSIQKIGFELKEINKLDEVQNQQLAEHIAGVKTLRDMYALQKKSYDERFNALEEPKKWRKWTWQRIVKVSGVVTLIAGLVISIGKAIPFILQWFF